MINERNIAQNTSHSIAKAVGVNFGHYTPSLKDGLRQVSRVSLRDGFDLSVYNYHADRPIKVDGFTKPCLAINVIIQGEGWADIHSDDISMSRIPYLSGTTYVCVMHDNMSNTMSLPKGQVLKGIDIRLEFDFLQRLAEAPNLTQLTTAHAWHRSSGKGAWVGYSQSTRKVLDHATCVLEQALSENPNDLTIESKVLEILSATFAQLKEGHYSAQPLLRAKHIRLIDSAHQLLLNDIGYHWTIKELSSRTGLNEKYLKNGFKQQYGLPIFQFLQNERLHLAKKLLQQPESKVVDVSLIVGYANPSHFAYLFKRQFGLSHSRDRTTEF
jgi:AraC-like DNA-binding protein